MYNGVNINLYQLSEYRKKFSVAFQDYKLFSCTLTENIIMEECSEKQVQDVQGLLNKTGGERLAADARKILGRQYHSEGLVLSGGQQQWIAVARLYFDFFEIAILDEPSAALDPIAATRMMNEVVEVVGNRTMLMISHDMSVSKVVDHILFLDSGMLMGQGTHMELMKRNKVYAEFYECQAENYHR